MPKPARDARAWWPFVTYALRHPRHLDAQTLPSQVSSRAELGFEELDLIGGLSPIRPRPVAVFLPLAAVEAALARSPKQLGPDAGTYTTRASALIRRAACAPAHLRLAQPG